MTSADAAHVSVEVPLGPTDAFDAFTAHIGEWFVINRFTVPAPERVKTVRIEPRVGGHLVYVEDLSTGAGTAAAEITEWEPPHRFSFVDRRGATVTVTFVAVGGGSRVIVEEAGFDSLPPEVAERRRRHSWHRHLPEWFESYLTTRRTQ